MHPSAAFRAPAFVTSGVGVLLRTRSTQLTFSEFGASARRSSLQSSRTTPHRAAQICATASSSESSSASTTPLLAALRAELEKRDVYAFVVPSGDPHNSEYAPGCYARRAFLSKFDGSAGTVVVTPDAAYLWTDGRYYLQAEQQLDENWILMRGGLSDTPTIPQFLAKNLPEGVAVGIDPFVHSVESANGIREAVEEVGGRLVTLEGPNPVDVVWGSGKPDEPMGKVRVHDVHFAGKSVRDKLAHLREEMMQHCCQHILFSMLDETCWVFNIRGDDIPHCPVVLSYGLVSLDSARLYVNKAKLEAPVVEELSAAGVEVLPYERVLEDVRKIADNGVEKIWMDPSSTSQALSDAAGVAAYVETTPVQMLKACKNEAELHGMREAHIRDGVALSSFLCWLEDYVKSGERSISEVDAAAKLEEFRAKQEGFLTTSFGTIAGAGPNGAIIHYSPTLGSCGSVSTKEVFLLDSGGQYADGTTDVTRTMHFGGTARDHEKECFTRVLQGHIGIDNAVFPEGTTGLMLDALARVPLWSIGLDYRHGTGHGVGACLNVHEGPQSISPRIGSNKAGIKAGMILSNEPGYYEDGSFGIRIENLLIVVKKETAHGFGGKDFLGFERLTFVPIDKGMIKSSLLSSTEVEWVDNYHAEVWEKLSPRMEDDRCREWLWDKTRPLHSKVGSGPRQATQDKSAFVEAH